MNNLKRNVVFVGFNENQKKLISEDSYKWDKFPKLIFEDTLDGALKHQGFLIVIKIDNMPNNFLNFDVNNRHYFKNFDKVIYCVKNYHYITSNVLSKMSKITFEPFNYIYNFSSYFLIRMYKNFLEKNNSKKTKRRLNNIENLNKYLKGKKQVTTEEVMKQFGVSSKWVQRYMEDVNEKYHNIGYNFIDKYYYIVKKR